jgi:hypothetical protein
MRTACIMGKMPRSVHDNLIPQFRELRRIPTRYRHVLPLKVMKQYRCAVIGSAQGVLTVAITNRRDTSLIETLARLTGHPIFPVWVNPTGMHLLIQRIERWEQREDEMLRWPHPLNLIQIHTIMVVSIYQIPPL